MRSKNEHHVDNIFLALGPRGFYTISHMILASLTYLPGAFQLLGNIFICRNVPFECSSPVNLTYHDPNVTVTTEKCDVSMWLNGTLVQQEKGCPYGIEYELPLDASAVSQFDLVCDRANLARLSQTLVIVGQGIGALVATILSDRFGRKTVMISSNIGMMIAGLAIAYAPNYTVFAVFKFMAGACQQGAVTSSATYCLEIFPTKDRRVTSAFGGIFWAMCTMTMALIAFLLREHSWRTLQLTFSTASLFVILEFLFMDESLRWLIANGKSERAMKVIKRAARIQKKDLQTVLQAYYGETGYGETEMNSAETLAIPKDDRAEEEPDILSKATKKLTLLDILRVRQLFFNALAMWFAWFTTALAFFAIYLNLASLSGNRFLNYFLLATMEIPSNIFFYFSLNRFGRKFTTIVPFALLGVSILFTGIFKYLEPSNPVYSHLAVVGSLLAMVGASGSFGIVYLYTPEMFPTNVRNQALGVSSFMGRVGGMLAPFTGVLAEKATWGPGVLIGCCSCFVCLLLKIIPETNGRELPQTVEELQKWVTNVNGKGENETNNAETDK